MRQCGMSKKAKRPRDINQLAAQIVGIATGEVEAPKQDTTPPKDAAAQALGRKGGIKGGRVRADKLTPEQRREIARAFDARLYKADSLFRD